MESQVHDMSSLFSQLGLPDDEASIRLFIAQHRPLPDGMRLSEAPFWSESQAAFLKEALRHDAEWSIVVDALSAALRDSPELASA